MMFTPDFVSIEYLRKMVNPNVSDATVRRAIRAGKLTPDKFKTQEYRKILVPYPQAEVWANSYKAKGLQIYSITEIIEQMEKDV